MDAILSFNARLQRGKMILDNLLAEEKLSRMPLIILQSSGGGGGKRHLCLKGTFLFGPLSRVNDRV